MTLLNMIARDLRTLVEQAEQRGETQICIPTVSATAIANEIKRETEDE